MLRPLAVFLVLFYGTAFGEIIIGAKKFTEGNVLAYIVAKKLAAHTQEKIIVKENLGGTGILVSAIESGHIDLYVDYTGTLYQIYKADSKTLRAKLRDKGVTLGPKLGFNNSYGVAALTNSPWSSLSELKKESFKFGVSHEFYKRQDGYNPLIKAYGLEKSEAIPMEHGLLYQSLLSHQLDVIEVYTTDAKLEKYQLKVLKDDNFFFPDYSAVLLYQNKFPKELQEILATDLKTNPITEEQIRMLNHLVENESYSYEQAAAKFMGEKVQRGSYLEKVLQHTLEHIFYVLLTVFVCVLIGVPLGILCARKDMIKKTVLPLISAMQTIPSLALLVFLIPIFGLGNITVLLALVMYGLLPIVKNTTTALLDLPKELIEYTDLLNMTEKQKLFIIELPMAKDFILAGVKLSTIYTIGITVLAAFVGAGGLGTLIVTGLSLNDHNLILQGAIPSALLAIFCEYILSRITKEGSGI